MQAEPRWVFLYLFPSQHQKVSPNLFLTGLRDRMRQQARRHRSPSRSVSRERVKRCVYVCVCMFASLSRSVSRERVKRCVSLCMCVLVLMTLLCLWMVSCLCMYAVASNTHNKHTQACTLSQCQPHSCAHIPYSDTHTHAFRTHTRTHTNCHTSMFYAGLPVPAPADLSAAMMIVLPRVQGAFFACVCERVCVCVAQCITKALGAHFYNCQHTHTTHALQEREAQRKWQ